MIGNHNLLVLSDFGNLNQLLETFAHRVIATEAELPHDSFDKMDDDILSYGWEQNDIFGLGCCIYEMLTGEIISKFNLNFLTFLKEIRDRD
jgi:hypothetical protein